MINYGEFGIFDTYYEFCQYIKKMYGIEPKLGMNDKEFLHYVIKDLKFRKEHPIEYAYSQLNTLFERQQFKEKHPNINFKNNEY
ncbi:MAG: hypothetical protein Satyrvirus12_5 [Satyrvirus sp.]|uniref:Uncharacterized protein n=1 Tax=Satyrvirus sp. TaxID=2487771 RepID=A0A3G5AGC9_9VIRU|nr:MAG: hypothetical protein Satyrvirus12_5 [Satyrvirus sp.]